MHKFKKITYFFLLFNLTAYLLVGLFIFIIDPHGINRIFNSHFNQNKISSNELTIQLYKKKLSKHKSILVFGSSRALKYSEDVLNHNQVIKPHHVYGNPHCVNNFLQQLTEQQINNIDTIYYNLSFHVFNKMNKCELSKYNQFDKFLTQTTLDNLLLATKTVNLNLSNQFSYVVNENGSKTDINPKTFNPRKLMYKEYLNKKKKDKENLLVSDDTLNALKSVEKFTQKHKIKTIYFTDALTDYRLALLDINLLKKQHQKILTVVPSFYGLNYIKNFSNNYKNFTDNNHITTKAAKYINDNIFNTKNYKVNKLNINNYLIYLEEMHKISLEKFNTFYLQSN